MVSCDICGKEFKNTQGLRGHKNFVHPNTVCDAGHPVAQQATEQPLSSNSGTRVTAGQRLSQLGNRFAMLEHFTGVREMDELEKLRGTDRSLNEKMNQLSEQLSKLTEQLKSEYVSREAIETMATELTGKSHSLQHEIANIYNLLVNTIQENRESCENGFSKVEVQLTTTVKELYELSKTVKNIQESAQGNRASLNQLNSKLISFKNTLSELQNKVARVKHLTRRVPTGEIVSIQLSDKREHRFQEYRSLAGLTRPYGTKRDLILGDRWIDLAEPEE